MSLRRTKHVCILWLTSILSELEKKNLSKADLSSRHSSSGRQCHWWHRWKTKLSLDFQRVQLFHSWSPPLSDSRSTFCIMTATLWGIEQNHPQLEQSHAPQLTCLLYASEHRLSFISIKVVLGGSDL